MKTTLWQSRPPLMQTIPLHHHLPMLVHHQNQCIEGIYQLISTMQLG
jgi:hypothetical protein